MHNQLSLGLLMLTVGFTSQAEVINSDWKVLGDGKTVTDTSTNLTWLDFTETYDYSLSSIVNELGDGGVFNGWRLPSGDEVSTLITNIFPDQNLSAHTNSTNWETVTISETNNMANLLGSYYIDGTKSYAWHHTNSGNTGLTGLYLTGGETVSIGGSYSLLNTHYGYTENDRRGWVGVYLVNSNLPQVNNNIAPANVPLPATASLLGLGILGFSARRKKSV
jgi:hypothetical protein